MPKIYRSFDMRDGKRVWVFGEWRIKEIDPAKLAALEELIEDALKRFVVNPYDTAEHAIAKRSRIVANINEAFAEVGMTFDLSEIRNTPPTDPGLLADILADLDERKKRALEKHKDKDDKFKRSIESLFDQERMNLIGRRTGGIGYR